MTGLAAVVLAATSCKSVRTETPDVPYEVPLVSNSHENPNVKEEKDAEGNLVKMTVTSGSVKDVFEYQDGKIVRLTQYEGVTEDSEGMKLAVYSYDCLGRKTEEIFSTLGDGVPNLKISYSYREEGLVEREKRLDKDGDGLTDVAYVDVFKCSKKVVDPDSSDCKKVSSKISHPSYGKISW